MEQKLISEGKCIYCEELFSKQELGKHLAKHLTQLEKESVGKNPSDYVHVEVEAGEMFLHILVMGEAQLKIIDKFLKDIWLECCGHSSAFGHKDFKIKMNDLVLNIFQPRIKIFHDYDFGTTTRVFLKAHKQYQLWLKEKIILLSRNEPLEIMCSKCKKKPAVSLCAECWYEEEAFFCEKCAEKHNETCEGFADYAEMPVVNSPRMGECGYTGGIIDVERDGVFSKK